MSRLGALAAISLTGLLIAAGAGCAKLGYTDRVLHRLPSPDGRMVAVCQEVPVFDGPEFDVRLERPDGSRLRTVYHMGDGGGCDELSWSEDGQILVVLTSHVAVVNIVDVEWALSHPQTQNSHWFSRGFSFSTESAFKRAAGIRFVSPLELEFQLCEYSMGETQRNAGHIRCSQPARPQRLQISLPLVADRPA